MLILQGKVEQEDDDNDEAPPARLKVKKQAVLKKTGSGRLGDSGKENGGVKKRKKQSTEGPSSVSPKKVCAAIAFSK